jgi:hypothetical protein
LSKSLGGISKVNSNQHFVQLTALLREYDYLDSKGLEKIRSTAKQCAQSDFDHDSLGQYLHLTLQELASSTADEAVIVIVNNRIAKRLAFLNDLGVTIERCISLPEVDASTDSPINTLIIQLKVYDSDDVGGFQTLRETAKECGDAVFNANTWVGKVLNDSIKVLASVGDDQSLNDTLDQALLTAEKRMCSRTVIFSGNDPKGNALPGSPPKIADKKEREPSQQGQQRMSLYFPANGTDAAEQNAVLEEDEKKSLLVDTSATLWGRNDDQAAPGSGAVLEDYFNAAKSVRLGKESIC